MTIQAAIDAARRLRGTEISDSDMIGWLSAYDQQLYDRVHKNYGAEQPAKLPYPAWLAAHTGSTAADVELMVEDKYGLILYPHYLAMMIDLYHADYDRYNNDAILFNKLEIEMRKDVSRTMEWNPTASAQSGEDVNRPWREDPLDTDGWFRTGDGGTGIRF